jgi:hypothetical protein
MLRESFSDTELLTPECSAATATEGITTLKVMAIAKISANNLFIIHPPHSFETFKPLWQ